MDDKDLWVTLLKGEKRDWIMTCGSGNVGPTVVSKDHVMGLGDSGLVSSHAYSVLAAYVVET